MATYDIPSRGLDKRKSGLNGLFGAGVYFGENSSKSDEYCGPLGSQGPFYVFLCRVAKGKPFITEKVMTPVQLNTQSSCPYRLKRHAPDGYDSVQADRYDSVQVQCVSDVLYLAYTFNIRQGYQPRNEWTGPSSLPVACADP